MFADKSLEENESTSATHTCDESLSYRAEPFLYPCTIEYCLLCSAVLFEMYKQLGRSVEMRARMRRYQQDREERFFPRCHRAHRPLFVGLIVVLATGLVCGVVLNLIRDQEMIAVYSYLLMELVLLLLCLLLVVVAVWKMRALGYKPPLDRSPMEAMLSMFGFVGVLAYNLFILVSSIGSVGFDPQKGSLYIVKSMVELFEGTLQTALIMDGANRFALDGKQVADKPGRACLTVLIIANITIWVIDTFKVISLLVHAK